MSSRMSGPYQVPIEAASLLRSLVSDIRLKLPEQVAELARDVRFTGGDMPFLPVPWKFTEAISALKGLEGAFSALLANERFAGVVKPGTISIDCDHAALFVFSAVTTTINGESPAHPSNTVHIHDWDLHNSTKHRYRQLATNVYRTKDGKFFHLHGSMNAAPSQKMVGIDPSRIDITEIEEIRALYADKVAKFDSAEISRLANEEYMQAGTICYTREEFAELEQGRAIANIPIYELSTSSSVVQTQTHSSWPLATSNKALSGIKVLELTRIIAGPAIGRGLAEHGATVLRITSDALPDMHILHPDLSQGKLQAFLDLKSEAGKKRMRELLADTDVLIDGYRPGCLERLGFGPEAVRELIGDRGGRGIVYVRENTYGWHGPWVERSGWQQISDCFTGISWGFGKKQGLDEPVVPIFPNSDYGTGVIGIIGVMHALYLRSHQGGSFSIDLSLSYYNTWLAQQGFYPDEVWAQIKPARPFRHDDDMFIMLGKAIPLIAKSRQDLFGREGLWQTIEAPSFYGTIRTLAPVVRYSGNLQLGQERPPVQNGEDPAEWPQTLSKGLSKEKL